jgi:hypothetical protein
MEEAFQEIGSRFARSIIGHDLESARSCLAPWLSSKFSAEQMDAVLQPRYEDMPSPAVFTLDGNSSTLADLEPTEGGVPTVPLPSEITGENFRKWMVIEFHPDPKQETGFDACFDLWMAVVSVEGKMMVGYYEAADPD